MKKIQAAIPSTGRGKSRKLLSPKALWIMLCSTLLFGGLVGLLFHVALFWEGIGPLGVSIKKVDFPTNGLILSGRLYQPKGLAENPGIPGIVMLHGTSPAGADLFLYQLLALRLAESGNLVFLYDQRGYGASPDPPYSAESGYALDFVDDAVNAVRFLAAQPQVDTGRLTLVGHSFGGSVAIGVCNTPGLETLLQKVVIISPGRGYPHTGDQKDRFRQQRLANDMRLPIPPSLTEIRNLFAPMEVDTLVGGQHNLPIQLIIGELEDGLTPLPSTYENMAKDGTLTIIPKADHYFSTNNFVNRLDLPIKYYQRAMIRKPIAAMARTPN
jgi:dienelactone hydrolase